MGDVDAAAAAAAAAIKLGDPDGLEHVLYAAGDDLNRDIHARWHLSRSQAIEIIAHAASELWRLASNLPDEPKTCLEMARVMLAKSARDGAKSARVQRRIAGNDWPDRFLAFYADCANADRALVDHVGKFGTSRGWYGEVAKEVGATDKALRNRWSRLQPRLAGLLSEHDISPSEVPSKLSEAWGGFCDSLALMEPLTGPEIDDIMSRVLSREWDGAEAAVESGAQAEWSKPRKTCQVQIVLNGDLGDFDKPRQDAVMEAIRRLVDSGVGVAITEAIITSHDASRSSSNH